MKSADVALTVTTTPGRCHVVAVHRPTGTIVDHEATGEHEARTEALRLLAERVVDRHGVA